MKKTWNGIFLFIAFLLIGPSSFAQKHIGQHYRNDKKLKRKLEKLLDKSNFKGDVGIYSLNLNNWKEVAIHADSIFPTASIVKLPIVVGLFKKILAGELHYHQPMLYRDSLSHGGSGLMQYFKDSTKVDLSVLVSLMMARSDNTAALWCQDLAGGGKAINDWLKNRGFKDTRVNSKTVGRTKQYDKYGWGQTTPREMADLMVAIREKEILTPAACERIYRDMSHSYWDDYALAEIPPYVQVASKQGMVNTSRSELVMVEGPKKRYVFYIATKNNKDQSWKPDNAAWQLTREISKLLWDYYEPKNDWKPPVGYARFWDWE